VAYLGSSSVKMNGNCFIDIDGIYDYHCLKTFFSYQSMKRIGLLKVYVLLGFIGWNLDLMMLSNEPPSSIILAHR
jgi:hypothetical protein